MKNILDNGNVKGPARENLPGTKEIFVQTIRHDLQYGFPLLTTRKLHVKGAFEELKWFLTGSTNVGELYRNGCKFWNEDVYKYNSRISPGILPFDVWQEEIKMHNDNIGTDAGKLYGYLWRNFGDTTDQIRNLINRINREPNSRYHVVSAWDPYVVACGGSALPSCHMIWQINVREGKYLDLMIVQRSCDFPIGVPINIASYSFLIHILCTLTPYEPGELIWVGCSVHIYENQFDLCKEQLLREPRELPTMTTTLGKTIREWDSDSLTDYFKNMLFSDFVLDGYNPHPVLNYPFSSGLVKK